MSPARIAAAVAAAVLAAGALWQRRRLGRERVGMALLAALALGVYASGVLGRLPNVEKLIEDVATALGPWTYALVGTFAFLETGAFVGLIAPGETVVIAGGVIAGQGEIAVIPLIGLVWLAAVLGDTTSFLIGRRLGRGFLMKHGPRVGITHERLEQVERYFARHGGKTILIGRFIGLVRALAPFIAGSSGMRYGRFLPYSVIGTGAWGATFTLLGYVFYRSFSRVADVAGRATLAFGIVVGVAVGAVFAYRRRGRIVAWLERSRWLRPLVPRLRFLWNRLTPGGLGIEFTTAVAVAVAGLYVFGLYVVVLGGDTTLPAGDKLARDIARDLRIDGVVDVVRVLTDVGALPVTGGLVAFTAALLAWRRRPAELVALVAGFAVVFVAVHLAKAGVDRPRPEGGLTPVSGQSYPSGHAAYATTYVAVAVAASRILPSLASRAALLAATLAVAVLVGLSRVYLGVHYWSDVAGGFGLGFGVYAVCAAIALLVTHIRHNGTPVRSPAPSDHG